MAEAMQNAQSPSPTKEMRVQEALREALRLVRGLARIAGGDLVASRDHFALVFQRG